MPAGRRNTPFTIQKSTETQSVGEPTLAWSTHAPWWAEELPLGGSEGAAGGQSAYATRRRQCSGLYVPGVHEGMRLLRHDGVIYEIDNVLEANRRTNQMVLAVTQRDTV